MTQHSNRSSTTPRRRVLTDVDRERLRWDIAGRIMAAYVGKPTSSLSGALAHRAAEDVRELTDELIGELEGDHRQEE